MAGSLAYDVTVGGLSSAWPGTLPKMLGALRDAMPVKLERHVAAELPKDLSDVPAHALYSHFDGVTKV